MLGPLNINLSEFGVSTENGFLPDVNPLPRLSAYVEWEDLVDEIPFLLKEGLFRQHADALPILDTSIITPSDIKTLPGRLIPPRPSPTATYAALNLWNFTSSSPTQDLTDLDKLSCQHTFTNTPDESWFYLVSVAIEARGAEVIPLMIKAMNAVRSDEPEVLISCLENFSACIKDCGIILERMYEKCDPEVFYHIIRPFLAGSKNMSAAGLPRGVFYDEGNGSGEWRTYSGGSNAQSSLIQFWDAVLGVKHVPTRPMGKPQSETVEPKKGCHGFLEEMRNYMPGTHRAFLNQISEISPIHNYVDSSICSSSVTKAYNHAVETLTEFRNIHIQIVTRYIINPSRKAMAQGTEKENAGLNLAVATTKKGGKDVRGTGGTQLIPFLKQSRDETRNMTVNVVESP
ncbi:Indoleamine 2,3-dioxygenase 1 [Botrytis cinerea]